MNNENETNKTPSSVLTASIAEAFLNALSAVDGFGGTAVQTVRHGERVDGIKCRLSDGAVVYEFAYIINVPFGGKRSTVDVRIFFPSVSTDISLSFYDIAERLGDTRCYVYPLIESPERMTAVVGALIAQIREHRETVRSYSDGLASELIEAKKAEIVETLRADALFEMGDGDSIEKALDIYYSWFAARMTSGVAECLALGKNKKAVQLAERTDATAYEKYIGKRIADGDSLPSPCADGCNTFADFAKIRKQSAFSDLGLYLMAWVLTSALLTVPFVGLYFVIASICSKGALYSSMFELYNMLDAVIIAMMAASGVALVPFRRMMVRSKDEMKRHFRLIAVSPKKVGCVGIVVNAITVASILFTALSATVGVVFTDTEIVDATGISPKGIRYTYADAKALVVSNEPYIELASGRRIDLSYTVAPDDVKENIVPIFEKYGIEVRIED